MKKIMLSGILITLLLTGCDKPISKDKKEATHIDQVMETVYIVDYDGGNVRIKRDIRTNVLYYFRQGGNVGFATPLYNEDGSIMKYNTNNTNKTKYDAELKALQEKYDIKE